MKLAYFRFYAGLNDFLPPERRMATFAYPFRGNQTVKSLVEDWVYLTLRWISFSSMVNARETMETPASPYCPSQLRHKTLWVSWSL
jgi:hypothetical protein